MESTPTLTLNRSFATNAKLRTERSPDGKVFIVGRAAGYNTWSSNLGRTSNLAIYEKLAPGCFDAALADDDDLDVICCADHNPERLLGKTRSGTLTLTLDSQGLNYKALLPDTGCGRDLLALADRGDVSFSSFAFFLPPDGSGEIWQDALDPQDKSKKVALCTITKISRLVDVSPLTGNAPAYPIGTSAGVSDRSLTMPPELRKLITGQYGAGGYPDFQQANQAAQDRLASLRRIALASDQRITEAERNRRNQRLAHDPKYWQERLASLKAKW
jgi:HK97 family phage prohead protease